MEVKNAVNINSFMDELLKIELNVEQEMVFAVNLFCRHIANLVLIFMAVLKILHRSPDIHDKVIYMNLFVINTSLTKFEGCNTW